MTTFTTSSVTAIPQIADRSDATPALWNDRYAAIDANFSTIATWASGLPTFNATFNVKDYGAACDGLTADDTAFAAAIAAAVAANGRVLVPGWMALSAPTSITDNDVVIEGIPGGNGSRIILLGGNGLVVNATSVTGATFIMRDIEVRLGAALSGYMLDVQASDRVVLDNVRFHNGGSTYAASTTKALRVGEVNGGRIVNPNVIGSGTDPFAVGLDLFQGVTGNRGNLQIEGGLINRADVGIDIANGASNLVNQLTVTGTKMIHSTQPVGSLGIRAGTRLVGLGLREVHIEAYEGCGDFTGVDDVIIENCNLSRFEAGVCLALKTQCTRFEIRGNRVANNANGGTFLTLDASQHISILVPRNSNNFSNVATQWTNASTPSGGITYGPLSGYPDVQVDQANLVSNRNHGDLFQVTLGGNRTMSAPLNMQVGDVIEHRIIQDGTGGRTLAWDAVFLNSWSDTGNTAGKKSTIRHWYDGTNWNQLGTQGPYV